ncbi:hypothetical protein JKP88DRAFT_268580 [Tribonema minus]|uniref:Bromo domain-containing protein n=1 Tax=Tribonema minus TaxID=303371 RepID=A0A836CFZ8_9STRA|nr:hypothetical protein JKP88DRAFT_268580 [Tribonema minus]
MDTSAALEARINMTLAAAPAPSYLFEQQGRNVLQAAIRNRGKKKVPDVISDFQNQVGLGPESMGQLAFISELGGSVAAVCKSAMEAVRRRVEAKIPHLDQEHLEALLTRSFPYVGVADMRSVPVAVMSAMKTVPKGYLQSLAHTDQATFDSLDLPLHVRRLVWQESKAAFERALTPHLDAYMSHKDCRALEIASTSVHTHRPFLTHVRRKKMRESLDGVALCIGTSPVLLMYLCDVLARRYAAATDEGKAGLWCTLLTDAMIAVRDAAGPEISFGDAERLCSLARFLDMAVQRCEMDEGKLKIPDDNLRMCPRASLFEQELQRLVREATGATRMQPSAAVLIPAAADAADALAPSTNSLQRWRPTVMAKAMAVQAERHADWLQCCEGHCIIKKPMAMSNIKANIDSGKYKTIEDMEADILLMLNNCCVYNTNTSLFYQKAKELERAWVNTIKANYKTKVLAPEPAVAPGASGRKRKLVDTNAAAVPADLPPLLEDDGTSTKGPMVCAAAALLCEPFAQRLLWRCVLDMLSVSSVQRRPPWEVSAFGPLVQLLEMAVSLRQMVRTNKFTIPVAGAATTARQHLPPLARLCHAVKLSTKDTEDPDRSSLKAEWESTLQECPLVTVLLLVAAMHVAQKCDAPALHVLMPVIKLCFKGDAGRALADDIRIWRSFATLVKPPRGPLLADDVCGLVWGIFAQAVGTGTPSCAAHSQALELLCHLKNVKAADDSTPQQGSPYAEDYLKVIFKALVAQVVKAAGGAEAKPEDGEPKADRKTGKSNRKTKGSEAKGGGTDPNSEEFKVEFKKVWHAENMAHTRSAYAKFHDLRIYSVASTTAVNCQACTSWPLWRSMLPAALSDAVQEAAADSGKKATLAPAVQTGA